MKPIYIIRGKVIRKNQRGRKLGFPTANFKVHRQISEGAYLSRVLVSGKTYNSATFIGRAITFKENFYHGESYLLDFKDNLYGRWITVKLYKKLRSSKVFSSAQSLSEQIRKDIINTRNFFKNHFL